ncbi:MAG: aminomethyl-transferring glycine dehydrogenase subunit GcvPB, partial [Defluviitaleaceae bacterium]|nr:aminomethyl-transferring glycine dehydrogenase subunit GcvPB [Defluviitaleaceae bacterium]
MKIDRSNPVRDFHQARWNEPIIFELSCPGERGVIPPQAEKEVTAVSGDAAALIPAGMKRTARLNLPEVAQNRVLRHYIRLSQQTLGSDLNLEIGQGTCTIKYSPKINEALATNLCEIHPYQPDESVQGILQIMHETEHYLKEISGMDRFSFQPASGSQAAMTMAAVMRAYHAKNGESERDEVLTTIYSHPSDAACPAVLGYKILYVKPDKDGYPDLEHLKTLVGPKTAGFFVANPEDTGIYNKYVREFTRIVREAGGLCCYDQANANGLIGVTRARDAGFDMCFFNLHKTFSTPHSCGGPAVGAIGVTDELAKFLPMPLVEKNGDQYKLQFDMPDSLGRVRSFACVAQVVLKAYAWIRAMGAEGLYEVAKIAVLNNNYMYRKLLELDYVTVPYDPTRQRVEQVRYTIAKLKQDTGITSADIQRRMMDFGTHYWTSHHPYYVEEPITLEPTETPSKADLDEYIAILKHVLDEAYTNPQIFEGAPHRSTCHRVDESGMDDPDKWAITWRSY